MGEEPGWDNDLPYTIPLYEYREMKRALRDREVKP